MAGLFKARQLLGIQVQQLARRAALGARPLGVNEAFLWVFIRGGMKLMRLENLHLASPRVTNLLGNDS